MISQSDVNGETIICQRDYAYDESGNIKSIDTTNSMGVIGLSSAEMVYNENSQLIEYNGETVKYDADGNMIYGPLNGSMAEFKYDCRNRLISAGGVTYSYDAENNRISKTSGDETIEYVVDSVGSLTRILTASTDSETTYYVYGTGLIGQEKNDEYLVYHYNNIGSTEAITDINGEIVEKFEYGPYGELLSENKYGIIFLYNGEYGVSTDENGLYYMRARYYNPEIKRFINQDVLIGTITDSPTLNRYAYVEGNPISLADPFGLSPAINWHTPLNWLGLLTFVPGLQPIGIAANAINAYLYFEEGNTFQGICSALSALPGLGTTIGNIGKAGSKLSTATGIISKFLHTTNNVGFIATGSYTIGSMLKYNYDHYIEGNETYTWKNALNDFVNGTFAVLSIYGGAKGLGWDKIEVPKTVKGSVDFGWLGKTGNKANSHENGNTKLYRVMSQDEYDSIMANNKFVQYDNAMYDKWFATSKENAEKWGSIFYPDGNYRMVQIEVSNSSLSQMHYNQHLDNIGPAYCASIDLLEEAVKSIVGVK